MGDGRLRVTKLERLLQDPKRTIDAIINVKPPQAILRVPIGAYCSSDFDLIDCRYCEDGRSCKDCRVAEVEE